MPAKLLIAKCLVQTAFNATLRAYSPRCLRPGLVKTNDQDCERLSISDVALKKICDRHRVPTPPRGYWAKKEAGNPVKKVSFVETADPQDERVFIYGNSQPELPESVKEIIDQHRIARAERAKSTFAASASVQAPIVEVHNAVVATAKALRKAKPDKDDVVSATGVGVYAIEVGVERVITIIDGLARALETQGLALAINGNAITVASGVDIVKFKLAEHVRREKHIPTVEELAKEDRRRRRTGNFFGRTGNFGAITGNLHRQSQNH